MIISLPHQILICQNVGYTFLKKSFLKSMGDIFSSANLFCFSLIGYLAIQAKFRSSFSIFLHALFPFCHFIKAPNNSRSHAS